MIVSLTDIDCYIAIMSGWPLFATPFLYNFCRCNLDELAMDIATEKLEPTILSRFKFHWAFRKGLHHLC